MQYLVQGDNGPQVKVTITRDGYAEDLTDATVQLHFRKKNDDETLFSLLNVSTGDDITSGIAIFNFGDTDLNIAEGQYEGEVEIVSASDVRETIYEVIDFYVREDFA